jgi:hypothetical protein
VAGGAGVAQIAEPFAQVNSAIHEVETGQVKARLVFDLQ